MPPLGDGCASQVVICVRVGGVSGVRSRRESADCSSGGARRHLVLARLEGQADQLLHDGVPALRGAAERARARVSRRSERLSRWGRFCVLLHAAYPRGTQANTPPAASARSTDCANEETRLQLGALESQHALRLVQRCQRRPSSFRVERRVVVRHKRLRKRARAWVRHS